MLSPVHLEVTVKDSDGVQVGKGTGERGEDLLGESEVDPLLQQHDGEVAMRRGLDGRGGRTGVLWGGVKWMVRRW